MFYREDWDNLNKEENIQKQNNSSSEGGNDFADREKEKLQLAASSSN